MAEWPIIRRMFHDHANGHQNGNGNGAHIPGMNDAKFISIAQHQWAIELTEILPLIAAARTTERIEPYQASLLLATNISNFPRVKPLHSENWGQYLSKLIEMHNDIPTPFVSKRRALQRFMISSGTISYSDMKDIGMMDNYDHPDMPEYIDTEEDLISDPHKNINHDRKPVSKFDPEQKTAKKYYAIPKDQLLPLLSAAMLSGRMNYMQAAIMLSVNSHSLETRNSGERYLDHVMAVAGNPSLTKDQQVVALLHDVIENSDYTFEDLRAIHMPEHIVRALEHITKRPDETVYLKFIQRCALNDDALAVKIADIKHNIRDAKESKLAKYIVALSYLEAVRDGQIEKGYPIGKYANEKGYANPSLFAEEKQKGIGMPVQMPNTGTEHRPAVK